MSFWRGQSPPPAFQLNAAIQGEVDLVHTIVTCCTWSRDPYVSLVASVSAFGPAKCSPRRGCKEAVETEKPGQRSERAVRIDAPARPHCAEVHPHLENSFLPIPPKGQDKTFRDETPRARNPSTRLPSPHHSCYGVNYIKRHVRLTMKSFFLLGPYVI